VVAVLVTLNPDSTLNVEISKEFRTRVLAKYSYFLSIKYAVKAKAFSAPQSF